MIKEIALTQMDTTICCNRVQIAFKAPVCQYPLLSGYSVTVVVVFVEADSSGLIMIDLLLFRFAFVNPRRFAEKVLGRC